MRKDMTVEYGESFIRVGKPVVDAFIKASGTSVVLPCVPVDGYVLISFEVNGTVIARRELFEMVEGSVTVGDYTIAYESGVVTISTTSSNDIVDIRIEPVDVVISDAFRAAVNETAPQTPNELPDVGSSDKGKYLHTNESTGALEWSEGGGSGGVITVHKVADGTRLLTGVLPNVTGYAWRNSGDNYYVDLTIDLSGVQLSDVTVFIGQDQYTGIISLSYSNGTLSIKVGSGGKTGDVGYTSEGQIIGLTINIYENYSVHLDKTWQEIADADFAVMTKEFDGNIYHGFFTGIAVVDSVYTASCFMGSEVIWEYITDSANGYPVES